MQLIGNNNVNIGTNIEKVDRIYNGTSTGDVCQTRDSASDCIRFNAKRGNKINLYKVILALYRSGYFVDEFGNQPDQKTVFDAFGKMLGADFQSFQKDLSEGVKRKTLESKSVFASLQETWDSYTEELVDAANGR